MVRNDYVHRPTDQVSCQSYQPIMLIVSRVVFDRDVLALDEAGFFQAMAKGGGEVRDLTSAALRKKPTTGIAACCACAASGHRRHPTYDAEKFPPPHVRSSGSATSIVTAKTNDLEGLKPVSRLQHEILVDVRFGS